jgi:hypothetical protein
MYEVSLPESLSYPVCLWPRMNGDNPLGGERKTAGISERRVGGRRPELSHFSRKS